MKNQQELLFPVVPLELSIELWAIVIDQLEIDFKSNYTLVQFADFSNEQKVIRALMQLKTFRIKMHETICQFGFIRRVPKMCIVEWDGDMPRVPK